jgi:hypothetical protein
MTSFPKFFSLGCLIVAGACAAGTEIVSTPDAVAAAEAVVAAMPPGYTRIGQLSPRGAREIGFSLLGIGGETLDRDFADFKAWKPYLEPLGAKWVRLQSGWAKTEKVSGQYDFAWLDEIVDGCLERGVQPWLGLSYGNPIYPGGGGMGLFGGMMRSEEALSAWDRYVDATVKHFRNRIRVYEVWNEADAKANKAEPGEYARLYERTVERVRREQPGALVLGLALAYVTDGAEGAVSDFVETLRKRGKADLIGGISLHGYPKNPDDLFAETGEIRAYLDALVPGAVIWQGETGAAAYPNAVRAPFPLSWGLSWTELSQAKWNLRRALVHIGRDMPYSQFAITDVHYTQNNLQGPCPLGLLESRPDNSIARIRLAYFAYRNACTIFSDGLRSDPAGAGIESPHRTLGSARFYEPIRGKHVVALWDNRDMPDNGYVTQPVRVQMRPVRVTHPVIVDLLTGQVFSLPEASLRRDGLTVTVKDFPLWDSPRLLCDRSLLTLLP